MIIFRVIKKVNVEENSMIFFTNVVSKDADINLLSEEIAYYNKEFSKLFNDKVKALVENDVLSEEKIQQIDAEITDCINILKQNDERFKNVDLEILRIVE